MKTGAVTQSWVTQWVEPGGVDHPPLGSGSGGGIERAVIEGGQDFPDLERGGAVGESRFFIRARIALGGAAAHPPKLTALAPWLNPNSKVETADFTDDSD